MTRPRQSPASVTGQTSSRDKAGDVFRRFFSLIERLERPPEVKSGRAGPKDDQRRPRITDFSAGKPRRK